MTDDRILFVVGSKSTATLLGDVDKDIHAVTWYDVVVMSGARRFDKIFLQWPREDDMIGSMILDRDYVEQKIIPKLTTLLRPKGFVSQF